MKIPIRHSLRDELKGREGHVGPDVLEEDMITDVKKVQQAVAQME